VYDVAPQGHGVTFYGLFEGLPVRKTLRKRSNKLRGSFSQVNVGEIGNKMLATHINNMREAHHSAVNGIKVNIASSK
jgi:hypothetical protein